MDVDEGLVNTTEAADILHMSHQALLVAIGRGKFEAKKIGRRWYLDRDYVLDLNEKGWLYRRWSGTGRPSAEINFIKAERLRSKRSRRRADPHFHVVFIWRDAIRIRYATRNALNAVQYLCTVTTMMLARGCTLVELGDRYRVLRTVLAHRGRKFDRHYRLEIRSCALRHKVLQGQQQAYLSVGTSRLDPSIEPLIKSLVAGAADSPAKAG